MKILGLISCYYSDPKKISENILSFINDIDHLILWENTPFKDSKVAEITEILHNQKIEIRTTGKNEYLADPFNECIEWGYKNGFTHVLTMDQDSYFQTHHFAKYLENIKAYTKNDVAMFGPSSNSREEVKDTNSQVDYTFLSGAIFPINIFIELGKFNKELVIDAIDTEYCLRAQKNTFKTIVFKNIYLFHNMGYRTKHWSGVTLVTYSAQRSYYYLRNTFWLWKEYPIYFSTEYKKRFIKYRVFYRLLKLIFEKHSLQKFKAICTAIYHYKVNKLGRFDKFQ